MPITEKKQSENIAAVIGTLRLEGLELDPKVIADMESVERGEITTEQAIQKAFDRVIREKI